MTMVTPASSRKWILLLFAHSTACLVGLCYLPYLLMFPALHVVRHLHPMFHLLLVAVSAFRACCSCDYSHMELLYFSFFYSYLNKISVLKHIARPIHMAFFQHQTNVRTAGSHILSSTGGIDSSKVFWQKTSVILD